MHGAFRPERDRGREPGLRGGGRVATSLDVAGDLRGAGASRGPKMLGDSCVQRSASGILDPTVNGTLQIRIGEDSLTDLVVYYGFPI